MRVPYSWLRDYVDISLAPDDLANRLTMAGLEVDRVDYGWPGIVSAEITWLEPIAGSDHLRATRVTTGTAEYSVVCGAPNIALHDRVPLATVGAKVGDLVIQASRRMGVLSEGMLCSPRELGISDDHSGILKLPADAPLGVPIGRIIGEPVFELDIKAHRGDLFCMTGIAREIGAFTGAPVSMPRPQLAEKGTAASRLMKLEVQDAELCPRYTARVVRNVRIGPSPQWMADRLLLAGMRPINNIVDVTNYVMLELGQPLHAFDYDKVAGHTIIVRRAKPGEKLTTLDGTSRTLSADMLLISDPDGPNVIAGIFGGERVEVSDTTTSILLEAAHFAPANVRRTSQALGIRTESSGRFEKNPDIELTALAIDRAAELIQQTAGGMVAPGRVDFHPKPVATRKILFDPSRVRWLTGMTVTDDEVRASLVALGFSVEHTSGNLLRVTVPTWRGDVEETADLVEEVARIVGYDRIPSSIPSGRLPEQLPEVWIGREHFLRDVLTGAGLTEAVTYTLTSRTSMARLLLGGQPGNEQLLVEAAPSAGTTTSSPAASTDVDRTAFVNERQNLDTLAQRLPAITLKNPLSSELESLRLTLMPGLLNVLHENSKHESSGLWFFELGRRYLHTPALATGAGIAEERRTLGIAISGPLASTWSGPNPETGDFFDVKGVVEMVANTLHIHNFRFVPTVHPTFHPGRCAQLQVKPTALPNESTATTPDWVVAGVLGEVHPEVAERFDIDRRVCLAEIDLELLYSGTGDRITFERISRFPSSQRDIAVLVPDAAPAGELLACIVEAGGVLLKSAAIFDVYTGTGVPAGMKSLAFTVQFQSDSNTLTDDEVQAAHGAIVRTLHERFGAELRS